MTEEIILASASPRRRELLTQIGVKYRVCSVDIDETPGKDEDPEAYVQRMAAEKSSQKLINGAADIPILAADTAVVIAGQILGKPQNKAHAIQMLQLLSGKTHHVLSAISLRGSEHRQALSNTLVTFRPISVQEIEFYWRTGEPADKAGAYAIQGLGGAFVASIQGSYSGVVGLPLFETAALLAKQGINIFHE